MKNLRKILAIVLVITMLMTCTVVASASSMGNSATNSYGLTDSQVMQQRDQIDGGLYGNYVQKFAALGLTFDDVKILQNQGLSYNAILQMGRSVRAKLGTARMAPPSSFVLVTNVAGSRESFHPDTGMVEGDFYDDNDGQWIEGQIENFITNVYGGIDGAYMYWLWGEWDLTHQTHQGNDQWQGFGSELLSAHEGEVISVGERGNIHIYDENADVTYVYAHCQKIQVKKTDYVNVGDVIGYEGDIGAGGNHLHFEVRNGRNTYMAAQNKTLSSLNPYDYM